MVSHYQSKLGRLGRLGRLDEIIKENINALIMNQCFREQIAVYGFAKKMLGLELEMEVCENNLILFTPGI